MSDEFVEMFKYKTGYEIVEPAHMVIFYNLLSFSSFQAQKDLR